ncbi:unnamed protein product [Protopolystoma xenopodis]|uniref:Uncharacterized protein n=1 Tax=Protopolystoma xenopodis TaxID=117903 RepID=A0A3S5FGI6_9PLAT|nr:unnamed protein product [Protopolystoma xenopodis]
MMPAKRLVMSHVHDPTLEMMTHTSCLPLSLPTNRTNCYRGEAEAAVCVDEKAFLLILECNYPALNSLFGLGAGESRTHASLSNPDKREEIRWWIGSDDECVVRASRCRIDASRILRIDRIALAPSLTVSGGAEKRTTPILRPHILLVGLLRHPSLLICRQRPIGVDSWIFI